MTKLTKRQQQILDFIIHSGKASNKDLKEYLESISRPTIFRDLRTLLNNGFIEQLGKGRSIKYKEKFKNELLRYIDIEEYFKKETDKRKLISDSFNLEIFKNLKNLFSQNEVVDLKKLNSEYQKRVKKLSNTLLRKEFERLTIELSWKSSKIEGNTYSLLETEHLIKDNKESKGHTEEEKIMILNHKKTLDYIRKNSKLFKTLSVSKIEDIHHLLTKGLKVSRNLRKGLVGITGTRYKPLDNQVQIKEALQKTCKVVNNEKNPFIKALIIMLMVAYIQPFEDGNKRTSRLMGNAVLLAHNICPLSFRSIDEVEYKKALLLFYEQNNIRYFKELFIEQFSFAVKNYFR